MQSRMLAYNRQWREFVVRRFKPRCGQKYTLLARIKWCHILNDFRLPPPADYMSENHESTQELLQYRIAFTCQIDNRRRFKPKVQFAGNYLVSTNYASPKWDGLAVQRSECSCRLATPAAFVLWEPFWIVKKVIFGKAVIKCSIYTTKLVSCR